MPTVPTNDYMTPDQVAKLLQVHPRTVYYLIEQYSLPYVRWQKVLRVPRRDLLLWLQKHGTALLAEK